MLGEKGQKTQRFSFDYFGMVFGFVDFSDFFCILEFRKVALLESDTESLVRLVT